MGSAFVILPRCGWAQVATTLDGPPVQVTPYIQEPGVPLITIIPGRPSPPPPSAGGGSGTETGAGGWSENGGGSGSGSDPLATMLSTSWGIAAVGNAEAVGINPSALAATCVLESGCGGNLGSGAAQGVFQMFPAAYEDGLQTALTANPQLGTQVIPGNAGMNDPTTEAIAASGYLLQANQNLISAGVAKPTVLDARGYYNFGPVYGGQLAEAQDSGLMASVLSGMSQSALAANGITADETVGQWRASVASQIGKAASQPVAM